MHPRNVVAFTFTERAAAELKERIASIVERDLGDVTGLAEMYVGTMHGYALDLLQRLVPDKFKFSVLTDITAQLLVDRYSAQSGLTSCPTTASRAPCGATGTPGCTSKCSACCARTLCTSTGSLPASSTRSRST